MARPLLAATKGLLLENPRRAAPRLRAALDLGASPTRDRRLALLARIPDFRERRGRRRRSGGGGPAGSRTERDRRRSSRYLPQEHACSRSTRRRPAVVGDLGDRVAGMEARDRRRAAPRCVAYNHAFLGFRVPAGPHEAVLALPAGRRRSRAPRSASCRSRSRRRFLLRRRPRGRLPRDDRERRASSGDDREDPSRRPVDPERAGPAPRGGT